MMTVNS